MLKQKIVLFLKGIIMGAADIVPGVSGGTMAIILGIYEQLIEAINNINPFHPLKTTNFKFFVPLVSGIAIAFLLLSTVMTFLLNEFQSIVYAFFLGLIISSAFILLKKTTKTIRHFIVFLFSAIITFVFVGINPLSSLHSLPVLFLSGFVAIVAMLLPGISGSYILILVGQYEYMLYVLRTINLSGILTFLSGAVLGLFIFSRVLDFFFRKDEKLMFAILFGMLIGAARIPLFKTEMTVVSFIMFLLGLGIVLFLEKYANKIAE